MVKSKTAQTYPLSYSLKEIPSPFELIPDDSIEVISSFKRFLDQTKVNLAKIDLEFPTKKQRLFAYMKRRDMLFKGLNIHFKNIWSRYTFFLEKNPELVDYFLQTYVNEIQPYFLEAEIPEHIISQPLGYAGDFKAIDYFYKYHDAFIGKTSFEVFLNDYTVTVPIALSSVERKNYFKAKLLETIQMTNPSILSVGSGAAVELLELIEERLIHRSLSFTCLDFDEKALTYVQDRFMKIPFENRKNISLRLSHFNVRDLLATHKMNANLGFFDYIYSAGLYDYLEDKIAQKLTSVLFQSLLPQGKLAICNVHEKQAFYRACYEFIGKWKLINRDRLQIEKLIEGAKLPRSVSFFETVGTYKCHEYFIVKRS